jgi:hypothetical protein
MINQIESVGGSEVKNKHVPCKRLQHFISILLALSTLKYFRLTQIQIKVAIGPKYTLRQSLTLGANIAVGLLAVIEIGLWVFSGP